jgi:CxxC-x17-CxxC domain-containing protein
MNNFKPGGMRNNRPDLGGRPKSDANYGPKNRSDRKPRHENRGGGDSRDNRGARDSGREMQMFQTKCTTCAKSCEVPFRPDGTKPVLCRDCFSNKHSAPSRDAGNRDRFTPNSVRPEFKPERKFDSPKPQKSVTAEDYLKMSKQVTAIEIKVNEIFALIKALDLKHETAPEASTEPKKARKTPAVAKAKKVVVKKSVKKAVVKKAPKKAVTKPAKKVIAKKPVKKAKK